MAPCSHTRNAGVAEESAVSNEVRRAVHEMPEWKEYDSEVAFELNLLRWRYSASGQKMTPARRAQMQAHAAQTQDKLMSEHAELAAKRYAASLTAKERTELRRLFSRLDPNAASGKRKPSMGAASLPAGGTGGPDGPRAGTDVGRGIRWSEDGYLQAPAPAVDPGEAMVGLQRAMMAQAEQAGKVSGPEAARLRRILDAKEQDAKEQQQAAKRLEGLPLSRIPSPGAPTAAVSLTDGRTVRAEDVSDLLGRAEVLSRVSKEFKEAEGKRLDARLARATEEAWAEGGGTSR